MSHFRKEGDEEESAGICVDHGVDSVECSRETWRLLLVLIRWNASKDLDGIDGLDERRLRDCRVVRRKVCTRRHTVITLVSKPCQNEAKKGRLT